ncbi:MULTISPECIES: aldose 1-epimerase family protein [Paenarthrobacter]|uniref:aldose 1-epimerase family protein n=1 Tax=Paenarthrobacter TaxID=1742992 RepID=UPI00074D2AAE|nr:aldose 1-epimerase family protein [Paenarthrobacter ureafaciens]AMB41837.1 galactose mutarotase [Arthrobacter sp. ATCC 21022]KUR62957.1 galactose mutarotase [Arthrobacter sp. ATCC 21022]RWW94521.1 galactose mutarotase [Paenarthrobacter ureafaciens]
MSTEFTLEAGGYKAVVTEHAAALRVLQFHGRDLVVQFPEGGPIPDYRGIIAAPWPNRIEDGQYTFDGVTHQLPVNEPERGASLHGLAFPLDWTAKEHDAGSVTLTCVVGPSEGYPFVLELTAQYALDENGLHSTVRAANIGESAAPFGVCPHPYLVAGRSPLNEWILEVPAATFLEVTPDRLLPIELASVEGHEFDFRSPRAIGTTEIDHAFTDIAFDGGSARLSLRDPAGAGVGMAWDERCPWLQIHTADKPAPLPNRIGLAVEPMTCPPDAFNSGTDLIRLEPGATHSASWSIYSL